MKIARYIADSVVLNNGVKMPQLGLGVWKAVDGPDTVNAVRWALETGYRLIDTATLYQNEKSVGEGLRQSGVPREKVFITTKMWNDEQGYEKTLAAFDRSLKAMRVDYLDLYLEHYPVPGMYLDTWKAMEKLHREGLVRAIGVSNFHPHHIDTLLRNCVIPPVVNQIELHPYLPQKNNLIHCMARNMYVEAWAPIAKGRVLNEPVIKNLARKYGKTPAQIVLRWELQQGIIIIPKSIHKKGSLKTANCLTLS